MVKEISNARDLIQDRHNANAGTTRGAAVVAESLSRYGTGRSVLVDKAGRIIAGNTTTAQFVQNGNEEVVVVQTDGKKLVVVQRTDLDLETDRAARELAHADNRTNQIGYTPNVEIIDADIANGNDLEWLWRGDELEALRGVTSGGGEGDDSLIDFDKMPRNSGYEIVVVCNTETEMNKARKEIQDLGYFTK